MTDTEIKEALDKSSEVEVNRVVTLKAAAETDTAWRVFAFFFNTGAVTALHALRAQGMAVKMAAFSEEPAAAKIIRQHIPHAADLGPLASIDNRRYKRLLSDWAGTFDGVLIDAGAEARCKDLSGDVVQHFSEVAEAAAQIGRAIAGKNVPCGFVAYSPTLPTSAKLQVDKIFNREAVRIGTETTSLAARDRWYWTNIPLEAEEGETFSAAGRMLHMKQGGPPPGFQHLVPPGFALRETKSGRLPTLKPCSPRTSHQDLPDMKRFNPAVVTRWHQDQHRYPTFCYEESNLLWKDDGEWRTWTPQIRAHLLGLPTEWAQQVGSEDEQANCLGQTADAGVHARVMRRLRHAPGGHKGILCKLVAASAVQSTVALTEGIDTMKRDTWPELGLTSAASYNEAITQLMPAAVRSQVAEALPRDGALEALVAPLRAWHQRIVEQRGQVTSFVGPDFEALGARAERAAAVGVQRGSHLSKFAVDMLVPEGLGKQGQLDTVRLMQHPFQAPAPLEDDVIFAIEQTVKDGESLAQHRRERRKRVARIAAILKPADKAARKAQSPWVARVAGEVAPVFIAFMTVFCMWPHRVIAERFLTGFSVMGEVEVTGVFRPVVRPAELTQQYLLQSAPEWHAQVAQSPPPHDAALIYEATTKEIDQGNATELRTIQQMDEQFGEGQWRGVTRFGVWQGEKFRPIDDGKRSGHNSGQYIREKVHHTPQDFVPAVAKAIMKPFGMAPPVWAQPQIGVDDLKDAYRGCPTDDDASRWSAVLVYDPYREQWMATMVFGHLYGFRSSVNNFNALPELEVTFCRRALTVPSSHYVDDVPTMDIAAGKGEAQRTVAEVFEASGRPFSVEKRSPMGEDNIFLGVEHDLRAARQGHIFQRPKPGRADTIKRLTADARAHQRLTPAQAGKLSGLLQFYASTAEGQLIKGGLRPIIERQYSGDKKQLTHLIGRALDFIDLAVDIVPPRKTLLRADRPVFAVWTDAEYDPDKPELGGGVGYVIQTPDRTVVGAARVPASMVKLLLPRKQQIGQLEALVPYIVVFNETWLQGCDVWWGVDNTSAESSLIKGYSSKADTASIVACAHILFAACDIRPWFFHVDSDSNPSDGASRDGLDDAWTRQQAAAHGWELKQATLPPLHRWPTEPRALLRRNFGQ